MKLKYTNQDGSESIITPAPDFTGDINSLCPVGETCTVVQDNYAPVTVQPDITVITKLQLKKYLMGLTPERWTELKTLLSADANMKEDWDLTTQLDITDPSVIAIASVMNMTLKDVFNAAGKL